MARPLTEYEVFNLECIVRDLILKGYRKRKPFTQKDMDKAVSHGVGLMNYTLRRCYPEDEATCATKKIGFMQRPITDKW